MSPSQPSAASQLQLAVFIDFENLALGIRDGEAAFDIRRVLDRLLEKGKVIAKIAYADWSRFREYTTSLHENGIELIEIPRRVTTGKNSADIRLVVDAMDLSWSKSHIDTFAIVSGDSDFSPLVAKLKENGKHVIGLGMRASTSPLLANMCDEFIYYENLEPRHVRERTGPKASGDRSGDKEEGFRLVADAVRALERENFEVIQASLVKDTIKRKRPAFSEAALGYGSFSELLEDAQEAGIVMLRRDERSGTWMVNAAKGQSRAATSRPAPSRPAISDAVAPKPQARSRRRVPAGAARAAASAARPTAQAPVAALPPAPEPRALIGAPAADAAAPGLRSRSRGRRRARS